MADFKTIMEILLNDEISKFRKFHEDFLTTDIESLSPITGSCIPRNFNDSSMESFTFYLDSSSSDSSDETFTSHSDSSSCNCSSLGCSSETNSSSECLTSDDDYSTNTTSKDTTLDSCCSNDNSRQRHPVKVLQNPKNSNTI